MAETIQNAMDAALRHHQAGRLPEAENLYRKVLASEPYHAEALHLLGVIAYQSGKPDVAIDLIHKAIIQKPQVSEFHGNLGLVLSSVGKLDEAIVAYRRALALKPNAVEVFNNLANALKEKHQYDQALEILQKAAELQPDNPVTQNNLGGVLRAVGKLDEAIVAYRKAVSLAPKYADALSNLGAALDASGEVAGAIASFRQAISVQPDFAAAYYNLGNILRKQKQHQESEAAYRKAISLRPDYPEAFNNLAGLIPVKGEQGMKEAISLFQQAIKLRPNFADAHRNLGLALLNKGDPENAIVCLEQAVRLRPEDAQAWNTLGSARFTDGFNAQAIEAFEKAAKIDPQYGHAYNNLGNVYKDLGELDRAIENYDRAIGAEPDEAYIVTNRLYSLNVHPRFDRASLFAEQRKFNERFAKPLAKFIQPHPNDRDPDRKLRIGYVSADFRDHVAAFNLLPILEHRDRSMFEVFCYCNTLRSDPVTKRFQAQADGWRLIAERDDEVAERMIREDRIDILMDLSLHSAGNRMTLFARKPAPVQATFIGYPGSTGLDTVDYRITDPYLDPSGQFDEFYSEKSLRLPETFWCYDPAAMQAATEPVSPLPALTSGHITFGCLCNFCKVNDVVLELWSKVFEAVPDSHLLLLVPSGPPRQRVLERFESHGIDEVRLEFIPRQLRLEYLKTYRQIDIGLDTLPYNGHTTSLDGYWLGVPVVTLIGQTVVGRAGLSQLCNLGLRELAAETPQQFVQIASDLAGDLPRLSQLRAGLRQRMLDSPLCNADRFTRNVEDVYRRIWRTWCQS